MSLANAHLPLCSLVSFCLYVSAISSSLLSYSYSPACCLYAPQLHVFTLSPAHALYDRPSTFAPLVHTPTCRAPSTLPLTLMPYVLALLVYPCFFPQKVRSFYLLPLPHGGHVLTLCFTQNIADRPFLFPICTSIFLLMNKGYQAFAVRTAVRASKSSRQALLWRN
jgi:hypothetical protein